MSPTIPSRSHQEGLCHARYSRIYLGEICFLSAWFSHQRTARCSPGVVSGREKAEVVVTGASMTSRVSGSLYRSYTRDMRHMSWSKLETACPCSIKAVVQSHRADLPPRDAGAHQREACVPTCHLVIPLGLLVLAHPCPGC